MPPEELQPMPSADDPSPEPVAAGAPEAASPEDVPKPSEGEAAGAVVEEGKRYTNLARRYAEMERAHAKSEKARKEQEVQLNEVNERFTALDTRLNDDPFGLVEERGHDFNSWTQRFVQKSPEEAAQAANQDMVDKIAALQKRLDDKDEAVTKQSTEATTASNIQNVRDAVNKRDDLSFVAKLNQSQALYNRYLQHAQDHGDCPKAAQEQIAQALEVETREQVKANMSALASVPEFREVICQMADAIRSKSDGTEASPAGEKTGATAEPVQKVPTTPTTLTQTQASQVSTRQDVNRMSTREESRARVIEKLRAKREAVRAL